MTGELLPQPAEWFRMSYCSYCVHVRKDHIHDGECAECIIRGNGFWPPCKRFTRVARTPQEVAAL